MPDKLITFVAAIRPHGRYAKSKGIILGAVGSGAERFTVRATNRDEAYAMLCKLFDGADPRPLAGKSYLRAFRPKVGQRVHILAKFTTGYDESGAAQSATRGTITEVVTDNYVSVHPDGYHNPFVDFTAKELVLIK